MINIVQNVQVTKIEDQAATYAYLLLVCASNCSDERASAQAGTKPVVRECGPYSEHFRMVLDSYVLLDEPCKHKHTHTNTHETQHVFLSAKSG